MRPFVTPLADVLHEEGYVVPDTLAPPAWIYYAPDAEVLLSDAFLENHCFQVLPPEEERVGLAFRPL